MKIYLIIQPASGSLWAYRSIAAACADPENPLRISERTWRSRRAVVKRANTSAGREESSGYPFEVDGVIVDCVFAKGMGDLDHSKIQNHD